MENISRFLLFFFFFFFFFFFCALARKLVVGAT